MSESASNIELSSDGMVSGLPRILCIVDKPDWIFERHVVALQRCLGNDFEFVLGYRGHPYQESDYDLIYPLEFNMVSPDQVNQPYKYVTGIRSFISWADWDFLVLVNFLVTHFQQVHVVSQQLFDLFSPYISGLWYVTHGVNTEFFSPTTPPSLEPGSLRIGWAGNRNTFVKGFREFIQPLGSIQGVELLSYGFADHNLAHEDMPGFYNSIDAYVCASSFEGNNNSLLESAAMARAIVTTPTGTVPEFLKNKYSAIIVERDLEQFESAVLQLRDNPGLRVRLGQNARQSLIDGGWDWKVKAEEYRRFFQSALNGEHRRSMEKLTIEPTDACHFANVLHTQFVLERELRIGYAYQVLEIEWEVEAARKEVEAARKEVDAARKEIEATRAEISVVRTEIKEIRESETYILTERIKSLKIVQLLIQLYKFFQAKRESKAS